jgi:hypothetical protein
VSKERPEREIEKRQKELVAGTSVHEQRSRTQFITRSNDVWSIFKKTARHPT